MPKRKREIHGTLVRARQGCKCNPCRTILAKWEGTDWCIEVDGVLECGVGMKVLCRVPVIDLAERMVLEGTLAKSIHRLDAEGVA